MRRLVSSGDCSTCVLALRMHYEHKCDCDDLRQLCAMAHLPSSVDGPPPHPTPSSLPSPPVANASVFSASTVMDDSDDPMGGYQSILTGLAASDRPSGPDPAVALVRLVLTMRTRLVERLQERIRAPGALDQDMAEV